MPQLESFALPALVLLIKATCLLLVALGASVLLQRASAGSRHLVWLVAVVGVLAMPAVAAWGPLPVRVLPAGAVRDVEAWPLRGVYRERSERAQGDSRARGDSRAEAGAPAAASGPSRSTAAVPTAAPLAREVSPAPSSGSSIGLGTMLFAAWAAVAFGLALSLGYGAWSV